MALEIDIIWAIIILLVFIVLTVIAYLIYSGLLEDVVVSAGKPPFKNLVIAYKFSRGPYKNSGALFTECFNIAPDLRCIGVYYDDPNEVAAKDLRYVVGSVISEGVDADEKETKKYVELMTKKGFKIFDLPEVSHSINVKFPFKNTISIFLAVWKVYPRLAAYIKERSLCAHPFLEVYENDVIHIVAPLAKQDEFYVPEATETGSGRRREGAENDNVEPIQATKVQGPSGDADVIETLIEEENSSSLPSPDSESKEGSVSNGEDSAGSSFEELYPENESDK